MAKTFHDLFEKMTISVTSPDRTVSATYTGRNGLLIAFRPGTLDRHDETSLAVQIEHALTGVNAGYGNGLEHIRRERGIPPTPTRLRDTNLSRNRHKFEQAAYELKAYATSPMGFVKVRIASNHQVSVRIQPGALQRMEMSEERLATELNTALSEAGRDYGTKRRQLRDAIHAELN